jgi:hypothetical protein
LKPTSTRQPAAKRGAAKKPAASATPAKPVRTKPILLNKIEAERRLLEKSLAALSDAELLEPGVVGDWSAKDVMAHLSAWERRLLQRVRGEPETGSDLGTPAFNEHTYLENRGAKLTDVQAEFQHSYVEVLALARSLSSAEVRQWWQAFAFNTYGHYRWAKTQLRQWTKRRAVTN